MNYLKQSINAMTQDILIGLERTKDLPSVIQGNEREFFIQNVLSKILPNNIRFGSGVIVDPNDNYTGQVDIIIEKPFSMSFPISSSKDRVYLSDSVLAAIEIKSDLQRQADEAFGKVHEIKKLCTEKIKKGNRDIREYKDIKIPTFVVAYKSPKKTETIDKLVYENSRKKNRIMADGVYCINEGFFDGRVPTGKEPWIVSSSQAGSLAGFIFTLYEWLKFFQFKNENLGSSFLEVFNKN
ncbi:DUF6602 domain-containing protein [Aliarcobacter butzleri]|uniref:DUF6602 domain-containing protein n=1 Tax=Aliarcobacter butzleri TaxID=28197 RepID=UPI003AF5EA9F